MGMAGAQEARDGILKIATTFTDMKDIVLSVGAQINGEDGTATAANSIGGQLTELGDRIDLLNNGIDGGPCTVWLSLGIGRSSFDDARVVGLEFDELTSGFVDVLDDFSNAVKDASAVQYTGTMAVFGVIMGLFVFLVLLFLLAHCVKVDRPAKCIGWFATPLCYFLCILAYLICCLVMISGSALGDVCYDPDLLIIDLVPNDILEYHVSCDRSEKNIDEESVLVINSVQPIIDTLTTVQRTMNTVLPNFENDCSASNTQGYLDVREQLTEIVGTLEQIKPEIGCAPIQDLYRKVIWSVLCGDVINMFAFLFGSSLCIAISLTFVVPLYKQVMRKTGSDDEEYSHSTAVVPGDGMEMQPTYEAYDNNGGYGKQDSEMPAPMEEFAAPAP
jgi:hypothetical protein